MSGILFFIFASCEPLNSMIIMNGIFYSKHKAGDPLYWFNLSFVKFQYLYKVSFGLAKPLGNCIESGTTKKLN